MTERIVIDLADLPAGSRLEPSMTGGDVWVKYPDGSSRAMKVTPPLPVGPYSPKRILVYHGGYGCDTGCCGHTVAWIADDTAVDEFGWPDETIEETFTFAHPSDDALAFAQELVRDQFGERHVADLDWEHSVIVDD